MLEINVFVNDVCQAFLSFRIGNDKPSHPILKTSLFKDDSLFLGAVVLKNRQFQGRVIAFKDDTDCCGGNAAGIPPICECHPRCEMQFFDCQLDADYTCRTFAARIICKVLKDRELRLSWDFGRM